MPPVEQDALVLRLVLVLVLWLLWLLASVCGYLTFLVRHSPASKQQAHTWCPCAAPGSTCSPSMCTRRRRARPRSWWHACRLVRTGTVGTPCSIRLEWLPVVSNLSLLRVQQGLAGEKVEGRS